MFKSINDFCGRDEVLDLIFDRLAKGSSCSLVGKSQSGKTSLLQQICNIGPQKIPDANFVYLDMQLIQDENDFFVELCLALGLEPCRGMKLYRSLKAKNQRYIVCLDEVEKMTNSNFSGNEQMELRGLSDGLLAPLTLVIASRSPLDQLFPDSPGKTSPLYNICQPAIYIEPI